MWLMSQPVSREQWRKRWPTGSSGNRSLPPAHPGLANPVLVVAGGVAANMALKKVFERASLKHGFRLVVPPVHLCTDMVR